MAFLRVPGFRLSGCVQAPPDGPEVNPGSVFPRFEFSGVIFLAPSFFSLVLPCPATYTRAFCNPHLKGSQPPVLHRRRRCQAVETDAQNSRASVFRKPSVHTEAEISRAYAAIRCAGKFQPQLASPRQ